MEPTSIGFLILLAAMGGGIAYLADMVGKKLGKKRLSLFGLRPRQTAALGTILLGVLITFFTICFVFAISKDMRQSILHSRRIRQELDTLEKELNERATHNTELTNRNEELGRKVSGTSKELKARQNDLQVANQKLKALNGKISSLESRVSSLTSDAAHKRQDLAAARSKLAQTDGRLVVVKKELDRNRDRLAHLEKENNEVLDKNVQLVNSRDELLASQTKLQQQEASLVADIDKIKKEVAEVQLAKEKAQSEYDQSQRDLTDVQNQLMAARNELSHTRDMLDEENKDLAQLSRISDSSREQPLIFRRFEEIARVKVPAGVNLSAANGALTLLLRKARVAAQERRAITSGVFDHPKISAENIIKQTLNNLVASPSAKVLIASSSLNAFRGERVSLELSVLPDPLVYVSGQMVAETVIEANQGDAVIYSELTAFLQDKVSARAKKDGMIPVANSDVPFGQITQADVLQLIGQLHTANRRIRLQAHAVGDTYAADALKLEFRLR